MSWSGTRERAVWAWRMVLGVDACGTEGTRQLRRAVSQDGAEAVRRMFAGRPRQPHPVKATRLWAVGEDSLVRALPAAEAARRTGRSLICGGRRRRRGGDR
jgi:hypothetical protein